MNNNPVLLYCVTGVLDCSGPVPDWLWWIIGGAAALTVVVGLVMIWLVWRG